MKKDNMRRDSMTFYRSFYEAIQILPADQKATIYDAIFEYSLNFKEVELSGISDAIFTLIKPQLEANNKKYLKGKKGGAPKGNKNASKKQPKTT